VDSGVGEWTNGSSGGQGRRWGALGMSGSSKEERRRKGGLDVRSVTAWRRGGGEKVENGEWVGEL
jgi:hypothetical protein